MPVNIGRPASIKDARAKRKRVPRQRNPVTVAENVTQAVQRINSGARRFRLRGPYCFVGYAPLEIEGYGHDESEVLESFADVFSTTWDTYAVEEDTRLSRDARQLKRQLCRLVAAVEPA